MVRTPRTGAGRYTHLQVTAATLALAWLPNADLADGELAYLPRMTASSQELSPRKQPGWSGTPEALCLACTLCPSPAQNPGWLPASCRAGSSFPATVTAKPAHHPGHQHPPPRPLLQEDSTRARSAPAPFCTHLDSQGQAWHRPMLSCPSPAPVPFRTHLDSHSPSKGDRAGGSPLSTPSAHAMSPILALMEIVGGSGKMASWGQKPVCRTGECDRSKCTHRR